MLKKGINNKNTFQKKKKMKNFMEWKVRRKKLYWNETDNMKQKYNYKIYRKRRVPKKPARVVSNNLLLWIGWLVPPSSISANFKKINREKWRGINEENEERGWEVIMKREQWEV